MRKIIVLVSALVLIAALGGCAWFNQPAPSGPITLVDDFDRTVELEGPAQKVISLVPANTEILFALGVGDRVVGASDFCNYPEEALAIQRVGGFDVPNLEVILSLEPDLVLAASLHKETVEALEAVNVPVLALNPQNIEEIYANIQVIAEAVGEEDAGDDLVSDMKERLDNVTQALAGLDETERPLVLYEVWYTPPVTTAGDDTFIDEIITLAGGANLAQGIAGWVDLQEEEVLERNPDIIIHGYPDTNSAVFAGREGWNVLAAVQADAIYYVNPDIVTRTGPRVVEAVEELARIFHPDKF